MTSLIVKTKTDFLNKKLNKPQIYGLHFNIPLYKKH
jgi:hypothetical protein